MALVVNKYINNNDNPHRGLKVKITLGNNNSSTWLIRSQLADNTKVWFGTATSGFEGYGHKLKSSFDDEGIETVTFDFSICDNANSLLVKALGPHPLLCDTAVRGVFGGSSTATWKEITDKSSGCELYIDDPDGVVELISVPVPDAKPIEHKHVTAIVPDEGLDENLAKWLLENPKLTTSRMFDLQGHGYKLKSSFDDEGNETVTFDFGIGEDAESTLADAPSVEITELHVGSDIPHLGPEELVGLVSVKGLPKQKG